jgi:hypothetical protein
MAKVIEFCANRWVMRSSEAVRRKLFHVDDVLQFTGLSTTTAIVTAVDTGGMSVLGRPVQLTLTANGQLVATDYGRQMTFSLSAGKLVYEAEYETGPNHEPDESGEGDPK